MEREFSLSAFAKLLKKFWYILLIAIIVGCAAGSVYAVVFSEDKYTVEASVRVTIKYLDKPVAGIYEGEAAMFNYNTAGDWGKVYNKVFSSEFDKKMVEVLKNDGYDVKENVSMVAYYEVTPENPDYVITITMKDDEQAIAIGNTFIEYVKEALKTTEVKDTISTYNGQFEVITFAPKIDPAESSTAMSWYMGLLIGLVAGVAIYVVIVLVLYFYNPKFLNVEEFNSQFDINVLEGDSVKNGYVNAAIKVRLALTDIDATKTVAVNDTLDAKALAESISKLGDRVLVADLNNLKNATVTKGDAFDTLVGEEIEVSKIEESVISLKDAYKDDYDYVVVVANSASFRKDYLMLADVADGAALKLDMNKTCKSIKADIVELSELKNINLIGVVF